MTIKDEVYASEEERLLEKPQTTDYESISNSSSKPQATTLDDSYNLIYILFVIQGVGMLLPWNFFITAKEYFKTKFETNDVAHDTFENAFAVGSQIPNAIAIFINLYLTGRVSRTVRVIMSLVIITLCFIVTTILVKVNTALWTKDFFTLTVLTVVIINGCSGIYQGTIFGIAGAIGGRYMQASMVGLGLGGIFAAMASFISLAASSDIHNSAIGYFSTASVVLFMCILAYMILMQSPYVKHYLSLSTEFNSHESDCKETSSTSSDGNSEECNLTNIELSAIKRICFVFKQIYPLAISVCFTFTIYLMLMPAVISGIKSTSKSPSKWNREFFSTLVCFLLFNAGDMVGRIVAGIIKIVDGKGVKLPLLCFSRIIFIPLLMFCNYQPRHHLPVYFTSDITPIVLTTLFAFTNGYCTSLCMIYGPQLVQTPYMETAGVIMQLFVSIGLSLGSGLSYPLVSLI